MFNAATLGSGQAEHDGESPGRGLARGMMASLSMKPGHLMSSCACCHSPILRELTWPNQAEQAARRPIYLGPERRSWELLSFSGSGRLVAELIPNWRVAITLSSIAGWA